jgi:hypothetical protein
MPPPKPDVDGCAGLVSQRGCGKLSLLTERAFLRTFARAHAEHPSHTQHLSANAPNQRSPLPAITTSAHPYDAEHVHKTALVQFMPVQAIQFMPVQEIQEIKLNWRMPPGAAGLSRRRRGFVSTR